MIKNIFYSLFLHFFIIILIYFNFQSSPPIEIDKNLTVAISFIAKAGNSSDVVQNVSTPQIAGVNNSKPQTKSPKKLNKNPLIKPKLKPKAKAIKELPKKNQSKTENKKENEEVALKPENQILKKEDKKEQENSKTKEEVKKDKENIDKKTEDEELEEEAEDNQDNQSEFTENSIENLDLLMREKSNIQSQIKRCYKKALEEDGETQITIDAHIFIDKEGSIDVDLVKFKNFEQYVKLQEKDVSKINKADFNKSIETVKKALRFCSPIRNLPQDKYNIWKEIDLKFD